MRLNDEGITNIANAIKDQWQYLRLSNPDATTYANNQYSGVIQTVTLVSSTVTDNEVVLIFELGALEANGETISMSALAKTLT